MLLSSNLDDVRIAMRIVGIKKYWFWPSQWSKVYNFHGVVEWEDTFGMESRPHYYNKITLTGGAPHSTPKESFLNYLES